MFELHSTKESFMVYAQSKEECDEWFKDIDETNKERQKKLKRPKGKLIQKGMTRPLFIPNDCADQCMMTNCDSKFSFVNRRHHCKYCGNLVCAKCSIQRLPSQTRQSVEKKDAMKVRVCDECYELHKPPPSFSGPKHLRSATDIPFDPRSILQLPQFSKSDTMLTASSQSSGPSVSRTACNPLVAKIEELKSENARLRKQLMARDDRIQRLLLQQKQCECSRSPSPSPSPSASPSPSPHSRSKKSPRPAPPKRPLPSMDSNHSMTSTLSLSSTLTSNTLNGINGIRVLPPSKGSPLTPPPPKRRNKLIMNSDGDDVDFGTLKQSTTEVIVDGEQYADFAEDDEEYEYADSVEEEEEEEEDTKSNANGLLMMSTPLSLVTKNRKCEMCKEDIIGRAVRAGDVVYHKKCYDKKIGGFDTEDDGFENDGGVLRARR